jgi:hypothetical protein
MKYAHVISKADLDKYDDTIFRPRHILVADKQMVFEENNLRGEASHTLGTWEQLVRWIVLLRLSRIGDGWHPARCLQLNLEIRRFNGW